MTQDEGLQGVEAGGGATRTARRRAQDAEDQGGHGMATDRTSGVVGTGSATAVETEITYTPGNLRRETGWWGAFVIGLAGTILVTGIAPVMVTALGASSIPITVFITITGWLLCLFLAEL